MIPCGVDPNQFKPTDQEQAKRVIGVQTGKIVLYVGRLEPLKGVHILPAVLLSDEAENDAVRIGVVIGARRDEGRLYLTKVVRWFPSRIQHDFDPTGEVLGFRPVSDS